jgi:N6-L-threonylcarbamoyladenine synthase/protein kinase Bud32
LTGREELVLGGGVGQNERLQGMLREMCEQRGADLYVPEKRFLRDNAGMVAVLGAKMAAAGETLAVADSAIDADFRPDEVPVTWRSGEPVPVRAAVLGADGPNASDGPVEQQGAEATVTIEGDRVLKRRHARSYRHSTLDERLRRERTRSEARLTSEARRHGVPTPLVLDVDTASSTITVQRVGDCDLDDALTVDNVEAVGRHLATIHDAGFVHGDLTTRNVRVPREASDDGRVFLIDFGLGYHTGHEEDHAMDLHVFAQSLAGTADDAERLQTAAEDAYRATSDRSAAVLDRLREIEGRGRYQ